MVGAGGVAMFTTGAAIGWLIADVVDRYFAGVDPAASPAPTLAAPYTVDNPIPKWNNDSQAMAPGLTRIGLQLLASIVFFGFGAMVTRSAAFKFFLYGIGGGALVHVSTQIITAYIIVPMVKSSTTTGARMYQHEINVYNGLANPSGGILGVGPANKPARRGLLGAPPVSAAAPPPQLPANQPAARMPVALASQATPPAAQQQQAPAQPPTRQEAPAMLGQPPVQQQPPPQQQAAPAPNGRSADEPHPLMAAWWNKKAA